MLTSSPVAAMVQYVLKSGGQSLAYYRPRKSQHCEFRSTNLLSSSFNLCGAYENGCVMERADTKRSASAIFKSAGFSGSWENDFEHFGRPAHEIMMANEDSLKPMSQPTAKQNTDTLVKQAAFTQREISLGKTKCVRSYCSIYILNDTLKYRACTFFCRL